MPRFLDVDPGELHLPPGRQDGAVPSRYHDQVAKYQTRMESELRQAASRSRRFAAPVRNAPFMRDPNRIPLVLQEIQRLWQAHPDWRLGQLVCNLAAWADPSQNIVWDVEDEILVAEAQRHLDQRSQAASPKVVLSATI